MQNCEREASPDRCPGQAAGRGANGKGHPATLAERVAAVEIHIAYLKRAVSEINRRLVNALLWIAAASATGIAVMLKAALGL